MTEREKMLRGDPYDPLDAELVRLRDRAHDLCRLLNATREGEADVRRELLRQLVAEGADTAWIQPPFQCDYGSNLHLGARVFLNFGCVVLDVCEVRLGDHVLVGPSVQIYTATHPLDAALRRTHELGRPVEIGTDAWIGGGAIVLPGVRIGPRSVVGAGSVVTRDVPADVLAAGNPCRVVRALRPGA